MAPDERFLFVGYEGEQKRVRYRTYFSERKRKPAWWIKLIDFLSICLWSWGENEHVHRSSLLKVEEEQITHSKQKPCLLSVKSSFYILKHLHFSLKIPCKNVRIRFINERTSCDNICHSYFPSQHAIIWIPSLSCVVPFLRSWANKYEKRRKPLKTGLKLYFTYLSISPP